MKPEVLCELQRGEKTIRRWLPVSIAIEGQMVWLGGEPPWTIVFVTDQYRQGARI